MVIKKIVPPISSNIKRNTPLEKNIQTKKALIISMLATCTIITIVLAGLTLGGVIPIIAGTIAITSTIFLGGFSLTHLFKKFFKSKNSKILEDQYTIPSSTPKVPLMPPPPRIQNENISKQPNTFIQPTQKLGEETLTNKKPLNKQSKEFSPISSEYSLKNKEHPHTPSTSTQQSLFVSSASSEASDLQQALEIPSAEIPPEDIELQRILEESVLYAGKPSPEEYNAFLTIFQTVINQPSPSPQELELVRTLIVKNPSCKIMKENFYAESQMTLIQALSRSRTLTLPWIRLFMSQGFSFSEPIIINSNNSGNTPLLWVIANGFFDSALDLLEESKNQEVPLNVNFIESSYHNSALTLIVAKGYRNRSLNNPIRRGHAPTLVEFLIKNLGADINLSPSKGYSPLEIAVLKRDVELVNLLINLGAVINKQKLLTICSMSKKDSVELVFKMTGSCASWEDKETPPSDKDFKQKTETIKSIILTHK